MAFRGVTMVKESSSTEEPVYRGIGEAPNAREFALAIANIRIDSASPLPIYEQITLALRSGICSGDLPPGMMLPSSRELAQFLGVSRNTVGLAYSRLAAEGYLMSHRRRGTRVTQDISSLPATPPQVHAAIAAPDIVRAIQETVDVAHRAQVQLSETTSSPAAAEVCAPDASLYPRVSLGRLLSQEFARPPTASSNHIGRFQRAIANHLRQTRGVRCQPEQIIILANSQCALDLLADMLIDPGHNVYIEEPTAPAIRAAFRRAGARIFPLPIEPHGTSSLVRGAPPPRLVVVSPSSNVPFGTQMNEDRRAIILSAANQANAVVVEYDLCQELVFAGSRGAALQALDEDHNVVYLGSLYETLGPHIQLTYLIVPTDLIEPFGRMAKQCGYGPDPFVVGAVAAFVEETEYAMHVKALRGIYGERALLLAEACRGRFEDGSLIQPVGGLCATLRLPARMDEAVLCHAARSLGVVVAPLADFYQVHPAFSGIVFGLGALPDRLIDGTLSRLAELVQDTRW